MKKLIAAFIGAFLIAACGQEVPSTGTVIGKRYSPSYVWYQNVCVAYYKSGFCRSTIPMPMTVPEEWNLQIRGQSQDGKKTLTVWVPVDSTSYHRLDVGSQWP